MQECFDFVSAHIKMLSGQALYCFDGDLKQSTDMTGIFNRMPEEVRKWFKQRGDMKDYRCVIKVRPDTLRARMSPFELPLTLLSEARSLRQVWSLEVESCVWSHDWVSKWLA